MPKFEADSKVTAIIPEDIYNKIPDAKKQEFSRGILIYLSREQPALYEKVQTEGEFSEELVTELQSQIRTFEEMLLKKKGLA